MPATFSLPVIANKFDTLLVARDERPNRAHRLQVVAGGTVTWDGVSEEDGPPQRISLSPDEARRLARALLYAADMLDAPGGDLAPTIGGH